MATRQKSKKDHFNFKAVANIVVFLALTGCFILQVQKQVGYVLGIALHRHVEYYLNIKMYYIFFDLISGEYL